MDLDPGFVYTNVPAEIWIRCFGTSSTRSLRHLAMTCRYFRDLFQPILFQHQRFTAVSTAEIDRHSWIPTTRASSPLPPSSFVLSVRSWSFRGTENFSVLPGAHPHIINIYLIFATTLGVYQNLRTLRLHCLQIDASFRDSLLSLRRLETLYLVDCAIVARTGIPIPVRHFSLTKSWGPDGGAAEPLHLVSPIILETLVLDDSLDASALLSAHGAEAFINLKYLTVQFSDLAIQPLLGFLALCPHLTQIKILPHGGLAGSLPDRLSSTAIPLLRSFHGPYSVAGLFILNRPVSDVTITGSFRATMLLKTLEAITHSSVAIRCLSLSIPTTATAEITAIITTQFPQLEELSLALLAPPTPPMDAPNSTDAGEVQVDERILELSDNDSLESVISGGAAPQITFPQFPRDLGTIEGIPDIMLPGHMYSDQLMATRSLLLMFSVLSPHARISLTIRQGFVENIWAKRAALPASLVVLRLTAVSRRYWRQLGTVAPPLALQHNSVLALERKLPALRELVFRYGGAEDDTWMCRRATWTNERTGTTIASLARSGD
ncbi:hypothetical protein DFH09DRAFT_1124191 [Mycena vulgaris]|nr:hypothetical protein DFH09DRAFT_1124191 [Mycena vulgaris]